MVVKEDTCIFIIILVNRTTRKSHVILAFLPKLATEKSSASVSDLQLLLYLSVLSFPSSVLTNHVSSTHSKHQASRAHIQANKVD
jgi:hypothetical protein